MAIAQGRISAGVGFNLIGQHSQERNQEATCYVGNLDPQVSEELLWELFIQGGPVVNMYVPKDRVTSQHQGYGFVEFRSEEDADYAIRVLNMIKLYGKPIRVNKATQDKTTLDVGANLFVGNLDADVDEKLLYDTFSAFGVIVSTPKLMREELTGNSRGFGFISYDSFEASDAAIDAMNGQHLCNKPITVTYAYKKDTKGERHGDAAERHMAATSKALKDERNRPHTMFATGPRPDPLPPPGHPHYSQQGGHLQPPPPMGAPPPSHPPPPPMPGMPPPPPPSSLPHMPSPPLSMPPPPHGLPQMPLPPMGPPPPGMPPFPPSSMPPPPSQMGGQRMQHGMPPPPTFQDGGNQGMSQMAPPSGRGPSGMPPPPMGNVPPGMPPGVPPGMPPPPMGSMPPGMPPPSRGNIPPWQQQNQQPPPQNQPPQQYYNNAPPPR
mmetsp:Transcript_18595/g.25781  ORF Transcript_18595/g.25781 Transcript_18595/m.25781 type:complete len:436 (+) Transcript_18595:35-1342(+)|eukprot:CAMPEP_0196584588 /NCGR_PEP_ID=MMETSP1081-20130531/47668_1 /TAXON_ID=36882 /ORGANISM="Pyramimonas amylifera, Strain CCMP720" /LENGTH=435 /DNA_ID=CAMNT_0041905845 /DNA_START=35 /DNA_END=1342 /DNA_ORIENTATION=-